MASLKVKSALICDEVRQENNGKYILVGVYTGGINFSSPLPVRKQRLYVFAVGETDSKIVEFKYRLISADKKWEVLNGETKYSLNLPEDHKSEGVRALEIVFPICPCEFTREGDYVVQIQESGRWKTVVGFNVSHKTIPS